MDQIDAVFRSMIEHEAGEAARIQHFVKVHGFAARIGRMEGMDEESLRTLELAALVHDIGIKPALAKHGSASGPLQELEGPPLAGALLRKAGVSEPMIERVCLLVSLHHSPQNTQGLDHQILIEADFLVNLFESESSIEAIKSVLEKVFVTESGKQLCRTMFEV